MKIDISELSNYLDISRRIIKIWIRRKMIPYYRKGRRFLFRLDEIDSWLERGREKVFREDLFR